MGETTKQKIINTAIKIFLEKGYNGTTMRDISNAAQINKGLLHYYFKSKNALFVEVLQIGAKDFPPKLDRILHSDKPFFEKIALIVDQYIELLIKNPHLPPFIINELNQNTDVFIDTLSKSVDTPNISFVLSLIQDEISKAHIKPVDPFQFILDTLSLILYPFLVKPAFKKISGLNDEQFIDLMKRRKKTIVDTLINNIKI